MTLKKMSNFTKMSYEQLLDQLQANLKQLQAQEISLEGLKQLVDQSKEIYKIALGRLKGIEDELEESYNSET